MLVKIATVSSNSNYLTPQLPLNFPPQLQALLFYKKPFLNGNVTESLH